MLRYLNPEFEKQAREFNSSRFLYKVQYEQKAPFKYVFLTFPSLLALPVSWYFAEKPVHFLGLYILFNLLYYRFLFRTKLARSDSNVFDIYLVRQWVFVRNWLRNKRN